MDSARAVDPAVVVNGTVTSFEIGKGYGFVADGGGMELFAPSGDIYGHGLGHSLLGQRVRFEVFQGRLGPLVVAVRRS